MLWTNLSFDFGGVAESIGNEDSIGFIGWLFFSEDVILWIRMHFIEYD